MARVCASVDSVPVASGMLQGRNEERGSTTTTMAGPVELAPTGWRSSSGTSNCPHSTVHRLSRLPSRRERRETAAWVLSQTRRGIVVGLLRPRSTRFLAEQSRAGLLLGRCLAALRCSSRARRAGLDWREFGSRRRDEMGLANTGGTHLSLSLSLSLSLFSYSGLRRESVPLQLSGQRICPLVSGTDSCSAARETSPRRPDTARSVPRLGKISPKSRLVHTRSQRASDVSGIDRMGQPSALLWAALAPLVLILIVVSLPRYPSQVLHTQS